MLSVRDLRFSYGAIPVLHRVSFYQRTCQVDEEQALGLRRAQWLEWTADAGF